MAFLRSNLHLSLTRPGFLSEGLVIFGDNAYVSTEYMVTPYKNVRAGPKDDFNFFHSQLRINIERAFGMLVKRWGVLQKPLPCQMGPVKQMALIFALCQLHNYCIGDVDMPKRSVPANNSNDLNQTTDQVVDEVSNNYVQNMINGGEHFDDVTDEELLREQSSRVRLAMCKIVQNRAKFRFTSFCSFIN
jgi:hypothetical protein